MLSARVFGTLNLWRNSSKNCERFSPGRSNMLGPARCSQRDGRRVARGSSRLVRTHQAVAPVVADPNRSTLACQGRVSGERSEQSLDTSMCFRKTEAGATAQGPPNSARILSKPCRRTSACAAVIVRPSRRRKRPSSRAGMWHPYFTRQPLCDFCPSAPVLIHGLDGPRSRHADEHANWKRHGRPTPLRELTGEEPNQDRTEDIRRENCATSNAQSSTTFAGKGLPTSKLDSAAQHSQLFRAPIPHTLTFSCGGATRAQPHLVTEEAA
jgi:hypothetical protein